jgi:hypothetical protein
MVMVVNVEAFGRGISYITRLNSFQSSVLTRRSRSRDDEEPDSKEPVPTSTATPTAMPTAKPTQPEVKRTAGENSALIGLGFLCLAFFRMTIVGW